jgi:hypothetical protein
MGKGIADTVKLILYFLITGSKWSELIGSLCPYAIIKRQEKNNYSDSSNTHVSLLGNCNFISVNGLIGGS